MKTRVTKARAAKMRAMKAEAPRARVTKASVIKMAGVGMWVQEAKEAAAMEAKSQRAWYMPVTEA